MRYIESITITLAFFLALVVIIMAILNFILKMRILNSDSRDTYAYFFKKTSDYKGAALKWAIMLFFAGLGLIVIPFVPLDEMAVNSPLPYGTEAVFLAMGFFVYYLVARKPQA
ncbi:MULTISPECIES: hypothetical protein [unclassified Mucilaginibacter]|uniref:hypothetical protein n=1 Tax=unclassified Mucilaginibacter TaxID=2617802 RepID=UPI0031F5F383